MKAQPVLKWSGAKWSLAPWIVGHLPCHDSYLEPFFGSGAILFSKPRSPIETVNDLSGDVCHLFRTLRERPEDLARAVALTPWSRQEYEQCRLTVRDAEDDIERARRFLTVCWQQIGVRHGREHWTGGWRTSRESHQAPARTWQGIPDRIRAAAERLQGVHIECRPALDVIARYDHPEVCIYADPPYPMSTRSRALYEHEMTDAEHVELLRLLDAHPGPVLLSGYACDLYDGALRHWHLVRRHARAQSGAVRVECLWINPVAVLRLEERQLEFEGLDDRVPPTDGWGGML